MMTTTASENVQSTHKQFISLKKHAKSVRTAPIATRIEKLEKLRSWIKKNQTEIETALWDDMAKPAAEASGIEVFSVLHEIKSSISNLRTWSRPQKVDAPLAFLGSRSYIVHEPKGVCLIIAPWNYPFGLVVGPLVSALTAGNVVVLKPSEYTISTGRLLSRMCDEVFQNKEVVCIHGGVEETKELLALPFDHIFFTGSPSVGKAVMKAAADHLTSVTLELGGKSPAIVTASSRLDETAERIAVGKFVNSGQTCVAPDYVLVHEQRLEKFVEAMRKQVSAKFPDSARIINQRHFHRIEALLGSLGKNETAIIEHGTNDEKALTIPQTLVVDPDKNAPVMQEEIFGPILPILPYRDLDEVISLINEKPNPLAIYIFSDSKEEIRTVMSSTTSGAVCVNDCAVHFLNNSLPFGGVGNSGLGRAHGYAGFQSFSNVRTVFRQKHGWATLRLFYPPYTAAKKRLLDSFLRIFY